MAPVHPHRVDLVNQHSQTRFVVTYLIWAWIIMHAYACRSEKPGRGAAMGTDAPFTALASGTLAVCCPLSGYSLAKELRLCCI